MEAGCGRMAGRCERGGLSVGCTEQGGETMYPKY
jgi:hypothetical protein